MIGYTREAFERGELKSEKVTLPEWMPLTWQVMKELKANGRFRPYEKELVRPDGSRWWGLFAGMQLDENENVEFILDITERKEIEKAMRRSEERFRAIADLVPDLLWRNNAKGKTEWCNQQWLEYTGLTQAEAVEDGWLNVIHPDDHKILRESFQEAIAAGNSLRLEHRIRRHDGDYRWFILETKPVKDRTGSILHWYGAATDIHDERISRDKLRRSEERFRFMANAVPQIVWITDSEGRVEFFNQVFYDYTGVADIPATLQEVAENYLHPNDIANTNENWRRALDNVSTFKVEHRMRSASGDYRWFLVRAEPHVEQESGRVLRWFGTSTDIQEQKLTEEALNKAKEEAEKAASTKEEFLSTMSHEIRTPLNAVIGLTNLLLRNNPREDQAENLNSLNFSAKNLMSLINDILDFSKMEAGKLMLEENEFDLADLLYSLKQSQKGRAEESGSQLQLNIDERLPQVIIADQLKLSQVLQNLLSNAIKFTHQGNIRIEAVLNRQENKLIWIDFSVTDTGIGIPADKISSIFERFTQADSGTMRNFGGTGLGLSISKRLLELMGSGIQVKSEEGKGSRFYFTLPVKAGNHLSAKSEMADSSAEAVDLQHIKILLVEDVEINRKILIQFFQDWWQLVPEEAVNGLEAVEKVKRQDYDLILMDVRMPEMDGYEASLIIRALPGYEDIPIIALTADSIQDIQQKTEAVHFTDVITKPFDPGILRQKIFQNVPVQGDEPVEKAPAVEIKGADFRLAEENWEGDPEGARNFYRLAVNSLLEHKKNFREALEQKDSKKLGNMTHKASLLINMLGMKDLEAFLNRCGSLLSAGAEDSMLEQAVTEGEKLFENKINVIQLHLRQRYS